MFFTNNDLSSPNFWQEWPQPSSKAALSIAANRETSQIPYVQSATEYNCLYPINYTSLITHINTYQRIFLPNLNRFLSLYFFYLSFSSYNLLRRINTNHLLYILSNILMYNSRSLLFFCCLLWNFLSISFLPSCRSSKFGADFK